MINTRAALVKEICKREGKKSQVAIGNVREIVAVIETIMAEEVVELNAHRIGVPPGVAGVLSRGANARVKGLYKKKLKAVKK